MGTSEITIARLGRLEAVELQEMLGGAASIRETRALRSDKHGDLGTIDLIVQLAPYALGVVGFWLLKYRDRTDFYRTIKVTRPDGTTREETIRFSESSSASPESSVVAALANLSDTKESDVREQIERVTEARRSSQ